ncbi:hypothetical protein D5S17_15640 [Pseudonocardiaceae bacterium YIM PH 21723]|nr:hypothetical protein D5S17_15640 [Pseudonocardiaceae bacterium YIM PH 21723]
MTVFFITIGVLTLVLIYQVRALIRDPGNRARWALALGVLCFLLGWIIGLALGGLDRYPFTEFVRWTSIAQHVISMIALHGVQAFFLYVIYPRAEAERRIRAFGRLFVVSAVFCVAVAGIAPPDDFWEGFKAHYAHGPVTAIYILVFTLHYAVLMAGMSVWSWRWSRLATDPWIRRGILVGGIGTSIGVVYGVLRIAYLAASIAGVPDLFREGAVTGWLQMAALILSFTGLTAPAWGPWISERLLRASRRVAHHRLHPLWAALTGPFPHVRMDLDGIRHTDLRLHLRVVQIWDARRALLPHCDPEVHRRELPNGEARAEAAMLTDALRRQRAGEPPIPGPKAPAPAAKDLAANVTWLQEVARAL